MPSWSPTNRRPRRWCWIWMRPTTRSMASRKAGSFTVTTATTVISRCTSSRGEHLLCARLRCSNIDGAAGSVEELERIVGRIRQSWPEVSIVIRADSGFCRDDLLRWCEDHHVDYVMGLANNDRLKSESAEAMTQAEAEFNATGRPARVFKDFRYRTRHSWTSERRVVGKAEFLDKGANPRFVVTSLSPERLGARALYEDFYCARGDMENRIKEQQLGLFADRTSAATMRANQLRLYLSSAAYMLMHALRSSRTEADPPGSRSVSDDSLEAPQDRRPGPPHGPPRLDLHVGSLSLQRGLRCRRSKPPGHSSALLRSVPIKRPQKRNRSIAQAELCLNTFRHALPNPKTVHSRPSTPPHHSTWTGSIAKLSENRSGLPKSPSFPNR